ncbi:MAG: TonB-dependent receptor domain-containing protein [bacterium]
MSIKSKIVTWSLFSQLLITCLSYGGITGTLSGVVRDKDARNVLPGAAIQVEGTTMGAMADKNGFFMIHNLPAGTYDVSASMIGYHKSTIKNVKINVDLVTRLDFYLSTKVLQLKEIVVTQQREFIQKDLTSSTYYISNEEINDRLPINSYREAVTLLPGVVGNHIRGGRETDALYLLDGLPIQGGLSREISSSLPNSSIEEMMVQTGGISAEYGQATSGVINIVSKYGRNQVEGGVKIYSDLFDTDVTGTENERRLELNVGGPLTIGLGGPLINANYFISADLNLSDTHWRKQMRQEFNAPIFRNYNTNSKLSFNISKNTTLILQGLLSNWSWRKFNPQWRLNLKGLAEHRHYSHRLTATLQHTFSPKLFATIRLATYSYKKQVLGAREDSPNLTFVDPSDPKSLILSGNQPWHEDTRENIKIVKVALVKKLATNHLLKTGVELQSYDLTSARTRFQAIPLKTQQRGIGFNKTDDNFNYTPRFFAAFAEDNIEMNGIIANVGFRYDQFDPRIAIKEVSQDLKNLGVPLLGGPQDNSSGIYRRMSPRLGVSVPLSENESLHVNYGLYYQMPPLYYVYTNAEHNLNGPIPLVGNLDLKPTKTIAAEFSYKRLFSRNFFMVVTAFSKKFSNLVDTQTFVLQNNEITPEATTLGVSRYTNSARGRATGLEITFQKRINQNISGRLSYTLMKATGTSSAAEDEFNAALAGTALNQNVEYPLSWDQRHSIVLNTDIKHRNWQVDFLLRLYSPLPVTRPGGDTPNNARLSWQKFVDIRIVRQSALLGRRFRPYLEIKNLFDEQNLLDETDDTGIKGYRLFDPNNLNLGRRLQVGMILYF